MAAVLIKGLQLCQRHLCSTNCSCPLSSKSCWSPVHIYKLSVTKLRLAVGHQLRAGAAHSQHVTLCGVVGFATGPLCHPSEQGSSCCQIATVLPKDTDEQTRVNMLFYKSHTDYFNDCGPFWKPRGGYRTSQMWQDPSSWLKTVLGDSLIHGQMHKLTTDIPSSLLLSQVVTRRTQGKPL